MADMILDASVFRAYLGGDVGARTIIEQITAGDAKAAISPLTVFELWGDPMLDRQTEVGYVGLLSFLEEAPLSIEAAKSAGIWIAAVEKELRSELFRSTLIAATARDRSEPICTGNPGLYVRFNSEVIEY